MKTLIIIILIILCLIIIKKHIEPFINITLVDYMEMLSKDEDIKRGYLNKMAVADKDILDKYRKLNDLKNYIKNNQFNEIKSNLDAIKKQYIDTKIKLERLIFNKYKTNSINFYEYNNEFKKKLMNFINNINSYEETNYGYTDPNTCTLQESKWRFNDNEITTDIKNKDKYLMDSNLCCKNNTIEECKKKYKEELNKINEQKLVLQNKNQVIKLNKYKYDLYIININNGYLQYNNNSVTEIKSTTPYILESSNIDKLLFRVVTIDNINHLNNFMKHKLKYTDIEFPLYLIYKEEANHFITFEFNNLSIKPLNKDIIKQQIFYKKSF